MLLTYIMVGFLTSLITVPFLIGFAKKVQIVDVPNARKIHESHIPLLGGAGIYIAYLTIFFINKDFTTPSLTILVSSTLIIILGILDDIYGLGASSKLLVQVVISTVVVIYTPYRFVLPDIFPDFMLSPWFSIILTYMWIIGITNAINLIDGMDGLASGISMMSFGAMGYVASIKGFHTNASISMGIMGATLGFLRYNLPPAKVFMGDTGSLFLGFNIAVMSLAISHKSATILSVLLPMMFVSLPIFDTFLSIFRRVQKGQNPFTADKEHLHHKLLALNLTTSQTLMIFYGLTTALTALSVFTFKKQVLWGAILVLLILYIFLALLKLSQKANMGYKIKRINTILARALSIESYNNNGSRLFINTIDFISICVTVSIFAIFIISNNSGFAYKNSFMLGILAFLLTMAYRYFSTIRNDFIIFTLYWGIFSLFASSDTILNSVYIEACIAILACMVLAKVMYRKTILIFISNPMEIVIIYFLMLLFVFSNTDLDVFIKTTGYSFVFYYATKEFFTHRNRLSLLYGLTVMGLSLIYAVR